MSIAVAWLVVRWLLGWALFKVPGLPRPDSGESDISDERVTVIIPARNEAKSLPTLLTALAAQTRRPDELVVIDDHSTDATADIAAAAGAHVVAAPDLPADWTGKSWAIWNGVQASTGDVLVFLDADTQPAPEFLDRLLLEQHRSGGIVSVQPYHRMTHLYERLSALFNLLAVLGGGLGRDPRRPGVGFGPAMATSRRDYLMVGGHESIRAAVVEDQALATRYADEGIATEAFAGRGDIAFRMYPHGTASIIEGFAKNFASGAGSLPLLRLVALVIWVSGLIGTSFSLTWQLGAWAVQGHAPNTMAIVGYLAFALQFAIMLRPVGNFGLIAWVMPVPVIFFLAVFAYSMLGWVRGYVVWKGRRIPVRPSAVRRDRSGPMS